MGGGHDALAYPVSRSPVLDQSQIRVLSSDFTAPGRALADPHPVLGNLGLGQGWDIADVGEVYPLLRQPAPTARAGFQGDWHFYWRISDLTGVGRLPLEKGAAWRFFSRVSPSTSV